jgi:hypothetical protein
MLQAKGCATLVAIALLASSGPSLAADTPDCATVRAAIDRIETAVGMRQFETYVPAIGGTQPERLVRVLTKEKQYVRLGGDSWSAEDRETARRNRKASDYSSLSKCKEGGKETLAGVATTRYDYLTSALKAQIWIGADGLPRKIVSEQGGWVRPGNYAYRYEYGAFDAPK